MTQLEPSRQRGLRDWRNDFSEDLLATHHAQVHAKMPFIVDRVRTSQL
jgi:hypothetical protein